ncbi:hypothetical protein PSHT_02351 [Puccinia striiformis]|uniref:Uncharacterized protein n=1 Tax=Puccinia striiformis TaxID=27350 RepID=A0A2S4WI53_9BASI|nr:hypothetical protein PSHT_02351 [Puccinia striiformis]
MSHSPSINDYKYIKKSISRQSWLAVTGKGGKRPQGPPQLVRTLESMGHLESLIIILRAKRHPPSKTYQQLELHTEPYPMTNILLTLVTLSCAILGLRGQATSNASGVISCTSYDFSGNTKVCNDKDNVAWTCAGTCTGSVTAHSCLLDNSRQKDPDTIDCKVKLIRDSTDESKFACIDGFRHSHTCKSGGFSDDTATCTDCQLSKST